MKMLTDNLLRLWPASFTLHASPFFPAALAQEFPVDTCNPYIPNEPNFQKSRLTVTLDMIKAYNDNQPKKRKKNEPKTHQKRTKTEKKQIKTNENEQNSTQFAFLRDYLYRCPFIRRNPVRIPAGKIVRRKVCFFSV